jgi:hypothetical protein
MVNQTLPDVSQIAPGLRFRPLPPLSEADAKLSDPG